MGRLASRGVSGESSVEGSGAPTDVGPDDLVWLALVPAAALTLAAIIWLAPLLASLVLPAASWKPFPTAVQAGYIRPEPIEHARFTMAVVAPFFLLAVWYALTRWYRSRGGSPGAPTWYVLAIQAVVAALVVACWISQRRSHEWFADTTLLVATGLGLVLVAMAWKGWIVPMPTAGKACRGRRAIGTAMATLLTGYWLLPAIFRTPNAVNMPTASGQLLQIQFLQDEFASVLNGRTPMVDFAGQYAKLLPFAVAPVLATLGPSVGVTTGILATLGLLGLLAVYGMFVVLTEDPLAAMVPYVPFLALSLFTLFYVGEERTNLATLFGVVPLRVLGPFVLGWLCARQLRKGGDSARVVLFVAAGLVAINNTEYGGASFVALCLALWCGHDGQSSPVGRARRLAGQAIVGGAVSVLGVCVLTLVRSGSLPDLGSVSNLSRVFAVEGFGMVPIRPALGLHLIMYLTFVVALVAGVVDAARSNDFSARARIMRGLLAYSGLLGLGAGAYWVGRSDPLALFGMFPTWGLAVAILCWAVLRQAAAWPTMSRAGIGRWAMPATGAVVAFGLMMTVVVQIPSPASQLRRFTADGPDVPQYAARVQFIAQRTVRGEAIAVLAPIGHLLARDAGVVNVSPYASEASIAFYEQMDLLLGIMRKSGATKAFVGPTWPETSAYLAEKGFAPFATDKASGLIAWQQLPASPG